MSPRFRLGPQIGLIALVLIAFAPAMTSDFVRWDDAYTLHHNKRLNPPTWGNVGAYWRECLFAWQAA